MHCREVQALLDAYVEGELPPKLIGPLEHHLGGCATCRSELAYLREVVAAVEEWPLVAEPARLRAQVLAEIGTRPQFLPRFRIRWLDVAISTAGAASIFAILFGLQRVSPTEVERWRVFLLLPLHNDLVVAARLASALFAMAWMPLLFCVAAISTALVLVWERRAIFT